MHTCKELLALENEKGMSIARELDKNQWWLKIWKEDKHSELYDHPVFIEITYCPFCGEKLKI